MKVRTQFLACDRRLSLGRPVSDRRSGEKRLLRDPYCDIDEDGFKALPDGAYRGRPSQIIIASGAISEGVLVSLNSGALSSS